MLAGADFGCWQGNPTARTAGSHLQTDEPNGSRGGKTDGTIEQTAIARVHSKTPKLPATTSSG
jgi:hypothetical protein